MPQRDEPTRPLVLASTSPFRRELLARLGLPFTTQAPTTDESPQPGETAPALVVRLAQAKAASVAQLVGQVDSGALVIGSDQVAVLDDIIIGKPGNHAQAMAQLRQASGRTVTFYTGLCLLDCANRQHQSAVEPFQVQFRPLTTAMIDAYLRREQPYQCAGSFKSEGLGVVLFERWIGDDPTSLIGLPLIRLTRMLENAGISIL